MGALSPVQIGKKVLSKVLPEKHYNNIRDSYRKSVKRKNDEATINKVVHNYKQIMFEKGVYDSFDRIPTPHDFEIISAHGADGLTCKMKFPPGMSIETVDKCTPALAENLNGKCMVHFEDKPTGVVMTAIKKWHSIPFNVVYQYEDEKGEMQRLTASQVLIGYDIAKKPIILDFAKFPHLIITGGSGGGKSKMVETIITNLAATNTPEELELYFLQAAKDDNFKYELLEHCRGCVTATTGTTKLETYQRMLNMLKYIEKEQRRRELLVKSKLGRRSEDINIHIYNEKFPNNKLPVLQLWVDEGASVYKLTSDKEINKIINEASYIIERIASAGRYVGVYLVNVMQRASKDELPREIKINSMNWISFNQIDAAASELAIGDKRSALGLAQRVFAYKDGSGNIMHGKTAHSMWNKNLKTLDRDKKTRPDDEDTLDTAYSHWFDFCEEEALAEIGKMEQKRTSKRVDATITNLNKKLSEVAEENATLKLELESNTKALDKLTEQNKSLIRVANMNMNPSINPFDEDGNVKDLSPSEVIDTMKDMEYKTSTKQKEEVSDLAENIQYKPLDMSMFKDRSSKRIKKK